MRYVLEGEWTGYTSGQRRVVHRVVLRKPYAGPTFIRYTDGTGLVLYERAAKPRERVVEIHGYDSLISKCIRHGVASVSELPR